MNHEQWERVNLEGEKEVTKRLRVFGGWLVITTIEFKQVSQGGNYDSRREEQFCISQTFVPDPFNEWSI